MDRASQEPAIDGRGTQQPALAPRPLVVDLCCGLGGWTEGFLAEGYRARGYDIEAHEYGEDRYPGELVIRDLLQMHGSEVADADVIVASPPCQEYSYMAMPWSLAKAKAAVIRADETGAALERLNRLFMACFRIQREACEAAGRHIPMVVENVKGARPWVGPATGNYGSYYLWGDVPALMPAPCKAAVKVPGMDWSKYGQPDYKAVAFNDEAVRQMVDDGRKNPGFRFDGSGKSFQSESVNRHVAEGRKGAGGSWVGQGYQPHQHGRNTSSGSKARKAASAKIAKIPFALSSWIARCYRPARQALTEAA